MSRSHRIERAGTKLAALAAPLMMWISPAAASPDGAARVDSASAAEAEDAASENAAAPDAEIGGPIGGEAPAAAPADSEPEELAVSPDVGASAPEAAALPADPQIRSVSYAETAAAAPVVVERSVTAVREPSGESRSPWIGAMVDVGVPDAATVSLVVRPIRSLRAHAGLSHNMISLGQRVGLTWAPLSWWVAPTVSVEYGHFADGNANPLARMVSGDDTFSSAVLDRVGYDYTNARLGLEFGQRWFTFYLHAGVSRITGQVHNLTAETMSQSSGTTSVAFAKDPTVQLTTVSARLGFIVYLAK
jgi:hypothetical protein